MSHQRNLRLTLPVLASVFISSNCASAQMTSASAAATTAMSSVFGTATGVVPTASIDSSLPQTAVTNLPYSAYIPDLSLIVAAVTSTLSTVPLDSTYAAGAAPTGVPGAPSLPSPNLVVANYPALDITPPINSTEVQGWLSKIDFSNIPGGNVTTGACNTDPTALAAAGASGNCWWTCGQCTRASDITVCPHKYDWGVSYDDAPSPWTPLLLDYLNEENITTTFFLVGSRVLSRPQIVQSEYMSGHMLSVHTWSHPYLTTKTNEEIVAELGWTMKVIRDVTGVTPNTFRPPYGDIDDRVRYIAAQMGLTPIIWTTANGVEFDTSDWDIPAGSATGESAFSKFETILETASTMNTGFIVLEHDLYSQTVELAVGYLLPYAINQSTYHLMSINDCLGWDLADVYIETSSNDTTWNNPAASASATSFSVVRGAAATSMVSSTSSATGSMVTTTGTAAGSMKSNSASGGATASATSTKSSGAAASHGESLVRGLLALAGVALGGVLLL